MTYRDLLLLLKSMEESNHSSMDSPVSFIEGADEYDADLFESLTTGELYLSYARE